MDRHGPTADTAPSIAHYLRDELYNRVRGDSSVFDFLQAGSLDGIWYLDIERPGQGWMSPRYKEVFGYRDDEVPNNSSWWREHIFAEDLAICVENFHKHCADPNHPFDQIVRYPHKNGSTVWVRCRGLAIRDENGKAIRLLGAHTDVTALKRTEERLRALYEASPDMYFVADTATGRMSECNQALLDNTGHAHMPESLMDLCDGAASVMHLLKTQPEVRDVELVFRRANRTRFTVLLSANTEDGRSFRAWCRDISFLRRFANLEVLLAALPSGVLLADERGVIQSANLAAEQLFAYEKGEMAGRLLNKLLVHGDGSVFGLRKNGAVFPIHLELSDLPLGDGRFQLATVADMTTRKRVEDDLREIEHRFRQLTESLPQLVWTCTSEGICDYLSPQWIEYTGIAAEKQLGAGWLQQVHPDDRDGISSAWQTSLERGRPLKFDYRLRRHDGAYCWFESSGIPLRNVQGAVVKWFGSSTDVHERREIRDQLEREQRRLANLIALAPAGFYSFEIRADGSAYYPFVSPDIVDLCGVTPEQLFQSAEHFYSLVHPDDLPLMRSSVIRASAEKACWTAQFRILHPLKGERWIEGQSRPAGDGTLVWHGLLQDITDRKQVEDDRQFLIDLGVELQSASLSEEAAQVGTRRTAEYFRVARCSFSTIDMARGEVTLLYQFIQEGFTAPPGTYSFSTFFRPEFISMLAAGKVAAIEDTAANSLLSDYSATAFQQAGIHALMAVPLRRSGQLVGLLTLTSIVHRLWSQREKDLACATAERIWPAYETARALAAERAMFESLRQSERRLQLVLQSAAIGIWEQDAVTGENKWDARARAIFGFPPDLPVDQALVMSRIHAEDRESVQQSINKYRDPEGLAHFQADYRIATWNGAGIRHVLAQGQMFFEGSGKDRWPIRAVGTVQDVTALKQGEQALRRANHELEQFAYAAAHDLQEPLRNVGLATQILASRYEGRLDDEADSLLKIAVNEPVRMQAMVKDLLAYARALTSEEGSKATADANAVLAVTLKSLVLTIQEKQAQITWETLPQVHMSELHLTQILQNLIGNSLKYANTSEPRIHISGSRRSGECVLSVKDNGPGIAPEYHQRAFGVFKRLHNNDIPGTGIGLALCKRIVEHYGGRIWIDSSAAEGMTVNFTVPA